MPVSMSGTPSPPKKSPPTKKNAAYEEAIRGRRADQELKDKDYGLKPVGNMQDALKNAKADDVPELMEDNILHGYIMGHMGKQGYADWKEMRHDQKAASGENQSFAFQRSDTDGYKGNDDKHVEEIAPGVVGAHLSTQDSSGKGLAKPRGRDLTKVSSQELHAHQLEMQQKHLTRHANAHWTQFTKISERMKVEDMYKYPARDRRSQHMGKVHVAARAHAPYGLIRPRSDMHL